jgi:hypothetical protein
MRHLLSAIRAKTFSNWISTLGLLPASHHRTNQIHHRHLLSKQAPSWSQRTSHARTGLNAPHHQTLRCVSPEPPATGTQVPTRLPASRRAPTSQRISRTTPYPPVKVIKNFSERCSGTLHAAGEGRKCNVTNEFVVKEYLFLGKFGTFGTTDNGMFNVPFGVAVNPSNGNEYVAPTITAYRW